MLNLQNKLAFYVDKYRNPLMKRIIEMELDDDVAAVHVLQFAKCGKGDENARNYVISLIQMHMKDLLEKEDLRHIREIVQNEYKKLLNKEYRVFPEDSEYIDYYHLLDNCMTEKDRIEIKSKDISKVTGQEEFCELLYYNTYGNGLIEPLLKLNVNNIEVHGTKRIRIETNKGIWKTIYDYRYTRDEDIQKTAKHLMAQSDKEDITEENCMQEGTMAKGYRVTVALKPGAKMNSIFIKKFDAFPMKDIRDLVEIGEITPEMYEEFKIYAKGRANILFIGGVNAGKTTLMNGYIGLIPSQYKIGIIESDFETIADELFPDRDITILRETPKFSLNDQFSKLLRMNRHILAITESRSFEVEQLIKAMLRGADGSFSTIHSRSSHDAINNMAWMALESGIPMDIKILRQRIASAVDIVVRLWHGPDGKRIVDQVDEVITIYDNLDIPYRINTIFKKDLKTNEVKKVGNISENLIEKFIYYNCTYEEVSKIIREDLPKCEV